MFRELCGESTFEDVVLVTTMWKGTLPDTCEAHENELSSKLFKPVLDGGAQMVRHYDTPQSAHDIIRGVMKKQRSVVLQIQHELVDQHKNLASTAAGHTINREFHELAKQHEAEMKRIREEMMQALKERDEEIRRELEEETRRLQEQVEKIEENWKDAGANPHQSTDEVSGVRNALLAPRITSLFQFLRNSGPGIQRHVDEMDKVSSSAFHLSYVPRPIFAAAFSGSHYT